MSQEYESQMKAYGIPVQSFAWKPTTNPNNLFKSTTTTTTTNGSAASAGAPENGKLSPSASPHHHPSVVHPPKAPPTPDLEACHLSSKQLEDLMEDDGGPVSNGDPMLSSPHLSPHGVMSSPASSSHYSDTVTLSPAGAAGAGAGGGDSMDLTTSA